MPRVAIDQWASARWSKQTSLLSYGYVPGVQKSVTSTCNSPLLVIVLVALLSGCAGDSPQAGRGADLTADETGFNSEQSMTAENDSQNNKASKVGTVELSARMIASAVTDLAAEIGVDQADIRVLRAIAVTWNDGSLGCPQPGHAYTQALAPGYWIVLEHAKRRYSFHAGSTGKFRLCKDVDPQPLGEPPGGRRDTSV